MGGEPCTQNKGGFSIFLRKNLVGCEKSYNFAPAFVVCCVYRTAREQFRGPFVYRLGR